MQIDLLRHGECEGGAIFRGSLDVPLTDKGWQQMQNGLAELNSGWDAIVSSPLLRCSQFATAVADQAGLPLQQEPDLREICFGQWEGQRVERIWREQTELCNQWSRAPDRVTPPEGEPFVQFRARVLRAVAALAQRYAQQRLLLVTHGGVIKLLLTEALNTGAAGMMQLDVGYGFSGSLLVSGETLTLKEPLKLTARQ
ncbi:histidine phosphatase family protein [uncultured Gilvimarinus sp.]|uniref:histidine phosphatase family protein n=1 Tax=uncultured Gilvimarinus sp. TaxID=1689143 RepID=UPI0030ED0F6B|tara:strand:+ start:877 stop:1470 length:594 start_codon:yes stop_codon:yes gene_type:complete